MRIARNIPYRTACAQFGIPRTEHNTSDMGLQTCPSTHRARFQGDNQRAIGKIPVPQGLSGLTHCLDLGVGQRVAAALAPVAAATNHSAVSADDHRPNRHLPLTRSLTRKIQRQPHRPVQRLAYRCTTSRFRHISQSSGKLRASATRPICVPPISSRYAISARSAYSQSTTIPQHAANKIHLRPVRWKYSRVPSGNPKRQRNATRRSPQPTAYCPPAQGRRHHDGTDPRPVHCRRGRGVFVP